MKYTEGLKKEVEEISNKYDKLAIKLRDALINKENLNSNNSNVLLAQKEYIEEENRELKTYIQELENIIKNGGDT